ncbi:6-amino-6-deoxyfutalosine synthase [Epsilonproteobacteria bacterium SCGC AD-308-O04]|nr:6-amino-6-deoxyfutalosine synthase [Epsilonproteobacteria bacterium SCGC AD-308-O04]
MVFGKIEYLNLLPFHVFMKRFTSNSGQSMSMNYKRGVPSKINKDFLSRRVDAAFISSVKARKHQHVNLGIIAKKEVRSVLIIPNNDNVTDTESATSNVLARVLNIKGEVLIGDKALRYYLQNKPNIDLAQEWNIKHNLPFVFALLCYHKDKILYKKIQANFLKQKIKIPQYILKEASTRTNISGVDILSYLQFISYRLDKKAQLGLKKFYKEVQRIK